MAERTVHLDSFSGPVSDLPRGKRTDADVLAALRLSPRVSTWDMSEHAWLRSAISGLLESGRIVSVDEPYPWHRYAVVETGND